MEETTATNQIARVMSKEAGTVDRYIDKGFSERAKKKVSNYALGGGLAFALPLFGLDNIIYMIILWGMYSGLSKIACETYHSSRTKNFIGGFIVNIIVASAIELALSFIPVVGWVGAFLVGYLSLKISGAAYLSALEVLYQGKVNERYNYGDVIK
ncbi:hypothetical protein HDR70_03445 [bacterium]|nr:hypothetical protein [bacterium]